MFKNVQWSSYPKAFVNISITKMCSSLRGRQLLFWSVQSLENEAKSQTKLERILIPSVKINLTNFTSVMENGSSRNFPEWKRVTFCPSPMLKICLLKTQHVENLSLLHFKKCHPFNTIFISTASGALVVGGVRDISHPIHPSPEIAFECSME